MIRGSLRGPKRTIHSSVQGVINEMSGQPPMLGNEMPKGGSQTMPPEETAPGAPPAGDPAKDPTALGGAEHESEEAKLCASAMKGLKHAAKALKKLKNLGDAGGDLDAGKTPEDDFADLNDDDGKDGAIGPGAPAQL